MPALLRLPRNSWKALQDFVTSKPPSFPCLPRSQSNFFSLRIFLSHYCVLLLPSERLNKTTPIFLLFQ